MTHIQAEIKAGRGDRGLEGRAQHQRLKRGDNASQISTLRVQRSRNQEGRSNIRTSLFWKKSKKMGLER